MGKSRIMYTVIAICFVFAVGLLAWLIFSSPAAEYDEDFDWKKTDESVKVIGRFTVCGNESGGRQ